ncbi:MAG: Bug family tripartite tricarboxylate transporter substrate binding protein [Rubrivivax sp.]
MRKMWTRLLALAGLVLAASPALAQGAAAGFPNKPVKLIVAAPAGSSPDAISRQLAARLNALWNQPVLVENVVGLGGITGTDRAAKQPADGYTILLSTIGAMAVNVSMMEKMPYDPVKDLAPITLVMSMPNLLVTHPSVPANNLRELIEYAKRNPGKLRFGHPGSGTSPHLAAELLNLQAGIRMQGIPYKSSAQMMTDLLGGQFEVLFHNSSVVLPHARSGAARLMGISSAERMATLADVPTVAEAAGLPGFAVTAWFGMYAPAGTPADILAKLNADAVSVLARPDVKGWIEQQGGVVGGGTARALADHQAAETRKWRELIRSANIKPD